MTFSQARQDLFVKYMTKSKNNGWYLEIGAYHPININNTFLLEKELNWNGISVEWDDKMCHLFNSIRKNKCYNHDATTFDFEKFLKENDFPKQIDYLSLDIEPPNQTFLCLTRLPLKDYRFSVITFEHDAYYAGPEYKIKAYELLTNLGYERIISNLKYGGLIYEDWYVDPNSIPIENWQKLKCENIEFTDISFTE